jgi:tetratricopeptide (TPR) repeat protein
VTQDSRLEADQAPDRLSGVIAIVIAFATLVAAVAGFLQAETSNRAGDKRHEAEQLSLQALSSGQTSQQNAQVELETFARWIEQRTQAGNALLASLYASSDPERQNELLLEQARWETVAAATLTQSDIDPASEFGPDQDPAFPNRYFARAAEESLRLNALQDAANEEASRLDQRAAAYTAILATLAVALYLFGLTLAVHGRWRRFGFLGVGAGLLAVGVLWLTQTTLIATYETSDEAATEFAAGRVAWFTARTPAEFATAEAHYARAIQLRPTYALAYADRAGLIIQAASPQRTGFTSVAPPEALARSRADLQTALTLGLENASTLGDLGFYSFTQGVQSADLGVINEGINYSRRALALDPGEPVFRYNLAVALTAAGRIDEARAAYQDAVRATIYLDNDPAKPRAEPFIEEQWLAGALTDLEIVRAHVADLERVTGRPGLEDAIRSLKEQIVGRVTAESLDAPAGSPAVFANIVPSIFPSELQWEATVQNYDAARDSISAQWYHNDPQGHGWAVIPEVSRTETPSVAADGSLFQLTPYINRVLPPACLPQGTYRVEIYVNGRLAAEGTQATDFGAYGAFVARDLTMGLCRPSDWVRRADRLPGLIDGFQSADGLYGAYAARYSTPGSLRTIEDVSAQIEELTLTAFKEWFPGTPVYMEDPGTTDEYFMGLDRRAWRWYDYGSGYVRVGAGVTEDGSVLLGMVYGPYDWFNGTEPFRILNSLVYVP